MLGPRRRCPCTPSRPESAAASQPAVKQTPAALGRRWQQGGLGRWQRRRGREVLAVLGADRGLLRGSAKGPAAGADAWALPVVFLVGKLWHALAGLAAAVGQALALPPCFSSAA